MALTNTRNLKECFIETNCFRAEWKFNNVNNAYLKLVQVASHLPRLTILEFKDNYWHGVVRSRFFRFPDDLEILKIPNQKTIQVRSASRIGLGDLGVNKNRVNKLYKNLLELI